MNWSKTQYKDLNKKITVRAMIFPFYQKNTLTEEGCKKHWVRTALIKINNGSIYKLLKKWSETCADILQHINQFQRERDGQGAYIAPLKHYLGAQHVNQAASAVDAKLGALHYKRMSKVFIGRIFHLPLAVSQHS